MKRSYSQSKEDLIVAHDLNIVPERILDIGANDGRTFSNSLAFIEEHGCPAVCVEADPFAFIKLFEEHKHRPYVKCVLGTMMPIHAQESQRIAPFTLFQDSLISTADPGYRDRWKTPKKSDRPIYTATVDWWDLIGDPLGDTHEMFDMISLDPEGLSPQLIADMPDELLQACRVFIIERGKRPGAEGYELNSMSQFDVLLETHRLYHSTSENLIYVRH